MLFTLLVRKRMLMMLDSRAEIHLLPGMNCNDYAILYHMFSSNPRCQAR
jgi:peptidase E